MPHSSFSVSQLWRHLYALAAPNLLCRGCLKAIDGRAKAGLCSACWSGLVPLASPRCPRCALPHDDEETCADTTAWSHGDALWDYHGGRPPLGALLVPGIKAGELGWREALLRFSASAPLPSFAAQLDCVTPVPAAPSRRWLRGFDLAEDLALQLEERLGTPFRRTLRRSLGTGRQAGRSQTERRRLARGAITIRHGVPIHGKSFLVVDDVWTTGTTLLRCAQALREAGAVEVRVLTLFRSTR